MPNYGKIPKEKIGKIKLLRSRGYSVPEISRELEVSKTSVLRHVRGVEILPEYLSEWAGKRGGSRKMKLLKEKQALDEMRTVIQSLSKNEKLLVLSALYWAEGEKKDLNLANTDPNLVRVFVNCMRDIFNIENDRIRITIRVYEDLDKDKCISFWAKVVNVPKNNIISVITLPGKKKGKLEYGMCRVRITKGGDLLKKIKGVNSIINEFMSL